MLNQKTKKPWESKEQKTILGKSRGKGGVQPRVADIFCFLFVQCFFSNFVFVFTANYSVFFVALIAFVKSCLQTQKTKAQAPWPPLLRLNYLHTHIYIYIGSVS